MSDLVGNPEDRFSQNEALPHLETICRRSSTGLDTNRSLQRQKFQTLEIISDKESGEIIDHFNNLISRQLIAKALLSIYGTCSVAADLRLSFS